MTANELNDLISSWYVPTSVERKKALLMYFLVWILIWLSSRKNNGYERFHLKQSMWWWLIFFALFIISSLLFFIPYIRVLPIFIFVWVFWIWAYFVKQVWKWEYIMDNQKIFMPIFYWIWWWMIDMFDIENDDEENKS